MEEDRGRSAERLVTFTDAVVAIAITLLALPLGQIGTEDAKAGFGAVLDDMGPTFLSFAISFFVIARLWWGHHRIFEHVVRWDGVLVYLTVVWLFTVVLLAPATAATSALPSDSSPGLVASYIGIMTVSSVMLTGLAWHIRRHPELTDGKDERAGHRLYGAAQTTVGFLLALVVGTAFPHINYFALFLLVLTGRVGDLIERRRTRRLNIR